MAIPQEEHAFLQRILAGDRAGLEELIGLHQPYLFNFVQRMVLNKEDAADAAQEIWIKAITHLSEFQGKSAFRTWLTRIAINHVLNMKRGKLEEAVTTFTDYGKALDSMPSADPLVAGLDQFDLPLLIEEVKIGCMAGMLLCLNREQRLVLVLGEIFGATDQEGAELLDITPANFRQKLTRARKDLYSFMNDKCGLINQTNPCRCSKKAKAFIDMGWVDPKAMKFADRRLQSIRAAAETKNDDLCDIMDRQYGDLFRDHPFHEAPDRRQLLSALLGDAQVKQILDL